MPIEFINQTGNMTANASNVSRQVPQEADIFTILGLIVTNPIFLILFGFLIGGIIVFLFYHYIWKKEDKLVFEFEKFEDIVHDDLKKTFELQGISSKATLTHGINNPIGRVDKWFKQSGEWSVMEYNETQKKYLPKEVSFKKEKIDDQGKIIKNKKGEPEYVIEKKPLKVPYDLHVFRLKPNGWFGDPNYVIAESKHMTFDTLGKRWQLDPRVILKSFGKAWITSEFGEQYLQDISFRRSLENNLTFLMNQSRKVIFLETAFAQKNELLIGKGIAKKLAYDQYAQNVLMTAGKQGESEEDET